MIKIQAPLVDVPRVLVWVWLSCFVMSFSTLSMVWWVSFLWRRLLSSKSISPSVRPDHYNKIQLWVCTNKAQIMWYTFAIYVQLNTFCMIRWTRYCFESWFASLENYTIVIKSTPIMVSIILAASTITQDIDMLLASLKAFLYLIKFLT